MTYRCVLWCDYNQIKKPITLKTNLSHAICNSKNEDTFFSLPVCYVFFSSFLLCHTIGHSPIFICQLPIYILYMCVCVYVYTMVCQFWLAGRYVLKPFNALVVPSQFNHRSILIRCFHWRTQTHRERGHRLRCTNRNIQQQGNLLPSLPLRAFN